MIIEGVDAIAQHCTNLYAAKVVELESLKAQIASVQAEIKALGKLTKAVEGVGDIKPIERLAPKRARKVAGEQSRGAAVLEILRSTPQSLDLGTIARKMGMEDTTTNRTKISAAITALIRGPHSPVVRVSAGVYAARTTGRVEEPEEEAAESATA
jgi:hypothetical protein